eukprot:scaffold17437_cov173-Amphora_coffeaeformis.AAC.3
MAKETQEELEARLSKLLVNVERLSTTESIGRRNVIHRRTQSNSLLSILDSPQNLRHRVRSLSVAEVPSILKFAPGSHLLEDFVEESGCLYLSLWLLPPEPLHKQLSKDIAKLSLRYTKLGSSAHFTPHVTIVGSIKCESQREASDLGKKFQKGLAGTGPVPCRFRRGPCLAMYDDQPQQQQQQDTESVTRKLIWSQSCIAIMERSEEYMNLLQASRQVLQLPPGEWLFPAPAREPHYSQYYGTTALTEYQDVNPPPDFVATEAALYLTTPGTVEGVSQWKEVTRISLV